MTTKVTRTLASLNLPKQVVALLNLAKAIVKAMTGNQNFPSPQPPLPTVTTAINDLDTSENVALTRAHGAAAVRNAKRVALVQLLQELKGTVQKAADASPELAGAIIESAGMAVHKPVSHKKRVFGATAGTVSGSVKLVAASAGRRASYEWEFSTDGGKTWQLAPPSLQARTVITGFQPGSTVSFRFRAVIKTGGTDWSEATSIIVK